MRHMTANQGWTHRFDDLAYWPAKTLGQAWETLLNWQSRAHRRAHLDTLDDHILRDVGLERRDLQREIEKPFWQG